MKTTFKTLVIGTSMAVGVAIATAPAHAGSLSGASIGGSAATDYLVYDSNATNTFIVGNTTANVQKVLDGKATNPGGNVELAASSEKAGFDFTKNTTLQGKIGDKDITLSSLTKNDWSSSYKGTTFGNYWFNDALSKNGFGSLVGTSIGIGLFNNFSTNGGFERFSDPNISYVNQDDTSGLISIGLAGHLNATPLLLPQVGQYFDQLIAATSSNTTKQQLTGVKSQLQNSKIQASEIVKYTYNGVTDYLYSFQATNSGLIEKGDGISHSGNYEVTIKGVPPTAVPEPSVMLGLLGVAGVFATQRKLKKVSG